MVSYKRVNLPKPQQQQSSDSNIEREDASGGLAGDVASTGGNDGNVITGGEGGSSSGGFQSYEKWHVPFTVDGITWDPDADATFGSIEVEYDAPAVSIDSKGRFAKHEVIGDTTVSQKIGEEPLDVSISGVCSQDAAKKIDSLRDATHGMIRHKRLPGDSLMVQFASASTSPLEDGGAVALTGQSGGGTSDQFLHSFDMTCKEIDF